AAKIKRVGAVPGQEAVGGRGEFVENALDFSLELIRGRLGAQSRRHRDQAQGRPEEFRSEPQSHVPVSEFCRPPFTIAEIPEKPGTERTGRRSVSAIWQRNGFS